MKKLIWKLVIPLTVLSFILFTKWWYTLPRDAPDTIFYGFPLPYVCDGWHTSLSLQFFCAPFLIDAICYFLFWFIIIFCIHRYCIRIIIPKTITALLLSFMCLSLGFSVFVISNKDNLFYWKKNFDMEIMTTGYKFLWQQQERSDYYKYHPEKKK
jgi:hypothetical protein